MHNRGNHRHESGYDQQIQTHEIRKFERGRGGGRISNATECATIRLPRQITILRLGNNRLSFIVLPCLLRVSRLFSFTHTRLYCHPARVHSHSSLSLRIARMCTVTRIRSDNCNILFPFGYQIRGGWLDAYERNFESVSVRSRQ